MHLPASLLIFGACALSCSCGSSFTGGADGGAGAQGASGAAGHSGTESNGGASHGGSNQAGAANHGGAAHGGSTASAGADSTDAGQAGAAAGVPSTGGPSAGAGAGAGTTGEGGAAGQPEAPPLFEPWALWPMPNAASSGLPHPVSYDTSTAGVVLDKVTGLVWQVSVSTDTYEWSQAKAYCANLVLAGFTDWRLPSRIELVSIVDYSIAKPGPVIDTVAFPNAPNTLFWTASPLATNSDRAWYVEFDNGFAFSDSNSAAYNVRCVR